MREKSNVSNVNILDQLEQETSQVVENIGQNQTTDQLDQKFAEIHAETEKVLKIKDENVRRTKLAILNSNLRQLRADAPKEQKLFAEAVLGIKMIAGQIDKQYDELEKPTAEEARLIKKAEERLEDAKKVLKQAEETWLPFFKETNIASAKQEIAKAEAALKETKQEVNRMKRERLMNADFEETTQQLNLMVERAITSMEGQRKDVLVKIEEVGNKKKEAFDQKEKAAEQLTKFDDELNLLEASVGSEEEALSSMVNNSKEYVAKEKEISEIKRQIEEKRSKRNAVLAVLQSSDAFSEHFKVHENTLIGVAADQRVWIMKMKSDRQERELTIKSRLTTMKSTDTLEIATGLNEVLTEGDAQTTEYMAKAGIAVKKETVEMLEKHPSYMKRLKSAENGQAQASASVLARTQEVIAEMRKKYGDEAVASLMPEQEKVETPKTDEVDDILNS